VVASKLLGERAGLLSGAALVVDYVLTIAISIAAAANALFAFFPESAQGAKLAASALVIAALVVMNLRGVKESVAVLTPIFLLFLVTHAVVIAAAIVVDLPRAAAVGTELRAGLERDLPVLGLGGLALLFARAYSLGGGTFTGIEAVSNGLGIMREPRVVTGKRTMALMAGSLALTAAGILLAYLLLDVRPVDDEPMNATLVKALAGGWRIGSFDAGAAFVAATLASEGALLVVAAQAGFIDGPRVMANMAVDSWLPHRLSALSEQLTIRNGIYLMGGAALAALLYTSGDVHHLVVMYSVNVFLTFTLSNLAMCRLWVSSPPQGSRARALAVHGSALALCALILVVTVLEKFTGGAWLTLVVTAALVAAALAIRAHYRRVGAKVARLDTELLPQSDAAARAGVPVRSEAREMDPQAPTAVVLVGGYGGLGLHTLLHVERTFPGQYRQVVFVSVGVVDSGVFKGIGEVDALERRVRDDLGRYVLFASGTLGWAADSDHAIGTDVVFELERLCREICLRFPRSVFFAGQLVFRRPAWWHRALHNETAYALQRRLQFDQLPMVLIPARVL
jgi:amino acid transporter